MISQYDEQALQRRSQQEESDFHVGWALDDYNLVWMSILSLMLNPSTRGTGNCIDVFIDVYCQTKEWGKFFFSRHNNIDINYVYLYYIIS